MNKPINLFAVSFIGIMVIYFFVLGENKTIEILKEDYVYILALIPLALLYLYFKFKLKDYEIINFNKNNEISLKSTILFFLAFQIYDYYSEGGFIGMISQWFIYWIMGILALLLMETINYYKNYKLLQKIK